MLQTRNVFDAVRRLHERCQGAYAVVAMIVGYGLVAFRDPNGIRPLVLGERADGEGRSVMAASESVALDVLGYRSLGDIAPGEAVVIKMDGTIEREICASQTELTPCLFEYVYLARPDSILDEISVYKARMRMGQKLAKKILKLNPDHDIDVVIPIPDSSTTAALQLAAALKLPYRQGFVKNRYVGRTFIMPNQEERKKSVRRKLNILDLEFKGKNVLLVDDSIVRGTTLEKSILTLLSSLNAKKVVFVSSSPQIRYPDCYGIDMSKMHQFVAFRGLIRLIKLDNKDDLIQEVYDKCKESLTSNNPVNHVKELYLSLIHI